MTYEQPADGKQGQAVGRVDFQKSANHSIFGRYMYTFDKAPAPYAQTDNVLTLAGGGGLDNLAQSLTIGDTLVFGTNLVNSLRVAFNRTSINRGSPPFFDPLDLGVQELPHLPRRRDGAGGHRRASTSRPPRPPPASSGRTRTR